MYELDPPNEEPDPQDEFPDINMQFDPDPNELEAPSGHEADIERQVEEALAGIMAGLGGLSTSQMAEDPELREEVNEAMTSPREALLSFRRPFGEGYEPSDSDAEIGRDSFHQMVDELLVGRPEADAEVDTYFLSQSLYLEIATPEPSDPAILARIYRQTSVRGGDYSERVRLYGQGEPGEPRKICDYVTGNGSTVTRRYDYDDLYDMPGGTDPIDEANGDQVLTDTAANIGLAFAMRLNGAPVGSDEINGLRDFLARGTPLQPQRHE